MLAAVSARAQGTVLPPVEVPLPEEERTRSAQNREPTAVTTVVDAKTFEGEAKDVAALLAPTPGATVQSSAGVLQRQTLSLRGVSGNGVLFLLDGMPLGATGATLDLSLVPSALVDRLEVIRGASPRLGPGALGGAVNVVTRRGGESTRVSAELSGGSFGTGQGSVAASGRLGPGSGLVLLHGARTAGDFGYRADLTPNLPGDPLEARTRANNDAAQGGGLLAWRGGSGALTFDVVGEGLYLSRGLAGPSETPQPDAREANGRGLLGARLTRTFESGGDVSGFAWARMQHLRLSGAGPGVVPGQLDSAAGGEVSVRKLVAERHGVEALASVQGEWLDTGNGRPSWAKAALMVSDEVLLAEGAVSLLGSVRLDVAGRFAGVSPKAGVLVSLPKGFELRGNLGHTFRPPSFLELYVQQGTLSPNPELSPERAVGGDVAVAWRGERHFVQLAGFAQVVDDLISYEYYPVSSAQGAKPFNFSAARLAGLELEGNWAPTSWLSLSGSATWLAAQNLKEDPRYFLQGLPYRPELTAHGRLAVGPTFLRGHAELLVQSAQAVSRSGAVTLPARALLGVGLTAALPVVPLRLTAEMKNVLDVQTQDLDGYPLPGRAVMLGLGADLEWPRVKSVPLATASTTGAASP